MEELVQKSQKRDSLNSTNSDPNLEFEPGVLLSDGLSLGDKRKKRCEKSPYLQSQTKCQQNVKKRNRSSRHKRLNTSNREVVVTTHSASTEAGSETGFCALTLLPAEMWLKIFQHCVRTDGPLPFLLRAGAVCQTWRDLTRDTVLWEKIDLSYRPIRENLKFLRWLAPNRLSGCRKIILNGWHSSTDDAVEMIAKYCPQLQTFDLSGSSWLTCRSVKNLSENCRRLKDLDLSYTSSCSMSAICTHLCDAGVQGSSLECLRLTAHMMEHLTPNFDEIMLNCPQLKELHLGNTIPSCESLGIDLNLLETSCPLLRVLDLQNIPIHIHHPLQENQAQANGLVYLQVLRCGQNTDPVWPHEQGILNSLLPKLLHNSAQLKVLDLYGYPEFDASVLLSLSAKALESLNLSRTGVTGHVLQGIFSKWGHSLKSVDLNFLSLDPSQLESAFKILTDMPTSSVHQLSLLYTRTPLSCVRMLTGKLKNLEVLQLEGSELPGKISRRYAGWHILKRLHQHICKLEDTAPAKI